MGLSYLKEKFLPCPRFQSPQSKLEQVVLPAVSGTDHTNKPQLGGASLGLSSSKPVTCAQLSLPSFGLSLALFPKQDRFRDNSSFSSFSFNILIQQFCHWNFKTGLSFAADNFGAMHTIQLTVPRSCSVCLPFLFHPPCVWSSVQ